MIALFTVAGRVQGVGFRAHCRKHAQALGLHGYARNLKDGSMEVLVEGNKEAVEALAEWLRQGPPLAKVDEMKRTTHPGPVAAGFEIG